MAEKVSKAMAWLVGGSVVGAGLGMLFAPYSGTKSRKKMVKFGRSMGNKSDRMISNVADFADKWSGKATKMLHR